MTERPDLGITQEEADLIIIHQVVPLAETGKKTIIVITDDTCVCFNGSFLCGKTV